MTLAGVAKQIEMWLVEKLVPWARNPRTHSDAQVAQIAASIDEFGFNNPILVDSKAGIIAGHGRLLAAKKLGLIEVPVIVLLHHLVAQIVVRLALVAETPGIERDGARELERLGVVGPAVRRDEPGDARKLACAHRVHRHLALA